MNHRYKITIDITSKDNLEDLLLAPPDMPAYLNTVEPAIIAIADATSEFCMEICENAGLNVKGRSYKIEPITQEQEKR